MLIQRFGATANLNIVALCTPESGFTPLRMALWERTTVLVDPLGVDSGASKNKVCCAQPAAHDVSPSTRQPATPGPAPSCDPDIMAFVDCGSPDRFSHRSACIRENPFAIDLHCA